MPLIDVSALTTQVLVWAFFLSCVLGWVSQKTHFCTMGALADAYNFGDWSRLRQWVMAAGVTTIAFASMSALGLIDPSLTVYESNLIYPLSALVGGVLFGVGMVLASGCGNKTLVRVGAGNLKALVVFLVIAVSAAMTMKGLTAVLRVSTVDRITLDLASSARVSYLLEQTMGLSSARAGAYGGLLLGCGLVALSLFKRGGARFVDLLPGLAVGLVASAMWLLTGYFAFLPEHPDTLQAAVLGTTSGKMEALTFVGPIANTIDWLTFYSDQNKVLTTAIVSVVGVVFGSAAAAVSGGTFRWEGFGGVDDLALHLLGACLMGIGGVTARGCTFGQGISGVSTLSITSFLAVAGIVVGALAALRLQQWRMERSV